MNQALLKICLSLGLVRERVVFDSIEHMAGDLLQIPDQEGIHRSDAKPGDFVRLPEVSGDLLFVPATEQGVSFLPVRGGEVAFTPHGMTDFIRVPAGVTVEGELHTNVRVIVAGTVIGGINVRGEAPIDVLPGAVVSEGLLSADCVNLRGIARDVSIDANNLSISKDGAVVGDSHTLYAKLIKDPDADISGRFGRRATPRDGSVHTPLSRPLIAAN